ncbi:aminotransferase class I/II-fold pyridoxal phosphate-dependent enzyme [Hyphococcus sp. DH-69]|uniref:aminotransferase class I/II-fold pyridoxal phosphate-dependent enzyme n=1 Tax=Hyphococcus formosus TaxID=3143534 RepID=UPI00398BA93B
MTQINHSPDPANSNLAKSVSAFAEAKLETLSEKGLRRVLKPTNRYEGLTVKRAGRDLISFSDNDYLGLSTDPRVIDAGVQAAQRYGAGAGASRLVTGENPLNEEVETRLSRLKGCEAALLFGSGYLANIGTIPALVGRGDVILLDELVHSCIHSGARLSGATIKVFRHNDIDHARSILKEIAPDQRTLLITETIFSMDGDAAPLKELFALCTEHDAWLMTDDAHGLGIAKQVNPAPIQMGTLSKAAGVYGGYVCGPKALIALLHSRARSFVYTTGLPPFVLGAVNASLKIIEDEKSLGEKALANAKLFCAMMDLPVPESTIVPIIIGAADDAMAFSARLEEDGFLVTAIRPPTVPEGTARLRIAFSARHREDDIARLAASIKKAQEK